MCSRYDIDPSGHGSLVAGMDAAKGLMLTSIRANFLDDLGRYVSSTGQFKVQGEEGTWQVIQILDTKDRIRGPAALKRRFGLIPAAKMPAEPSTVSTFESLTMSVFLGVGHF